MKPNALTSLRALSGNVGSQIRMQEVHTPEWIIDAVREALGGTIDIDPCAASNKAHWFARKNYTLPPEAVLLERKLEVAKLERDAKSAKQIKKLLKPYYLGGALTATWASGSAFGNVPYGFLQHWLKRFQREGLAGRKCVGLWPVRTHRKWWSAGHAGAQVVYLHYDVRFVGHTSAFPAPLCLAAFNCVIPDLGKRETFRDDFEVAA